MQQVKQHARTAAAIRLISRLTRIISNYSITWPDTATADITPKPVTAKVELTNSSKSIVYDGTAKTPDVTITFTDGDNKEVSDIQKDSDYTVTYTNNINAGTATVTVKNVDGSNYSFSVTASFTIDKADPTVSAPIGKTDLTYTGVA